MWLCGYVTGCVQCDQCSGCTGGLKNRMTRSVILEKIRVDLLLLQRRPRKTQENLAVLIQEELEEGLDNDWLLLLREVIFTTLFMLRFQKFCREIKKPFICT